MSAWLLSWNPEHFSDGGDGDANGRLDLAPGTERRWSCHSKQPVVGDTIYLIRLGIEPRGIIARGTVSATPYEDANWKDADSQRTYLKFRVDEARLDCPSGLLPILLLERAFPAQRWSPQQSGISINATVAEGLASLWSAGAGKHSLRQFSDWYATHPGVNEVDWLPRYADITNLAAEIRAGQRPLDEDAMRRLWIQTDNGVSSLRQGVVSRDRFAANYEWLRGVTQDIAKSPTSPICQRVLTEWLQDGRFTQKLSSAVHRVFAAFAPKNLTTVLNDETCWKLLRILATQFQFPKPKRGDWFELNAQINACMAEARLDPAQHLQNNSAMWSLVDGPPEPGPGPHEEQDDERPTPPPTRQTMNIPLNQILYGPPGTGKTYHTITKALEILNPSMAGHGVGRDLQVAEFNRLVANGQVVFCTFHQSFSYEDFVEGLRADASEGQLRYDVADGIFKSLCERASTGVTAENDELTKALGRLDEKIATADGELLRLKTTRGREFDVSSPTGSSYRVLPKASQDPDRHNFRASVRDLHKFYATKDPRQVHNSSYVRGILEYLEDKCDLPPYVAATERREALNFVMVIDEINRGNVSRVFGELITLIEASKRQGAESLEVVLPYSKERFSVPSNVYLIGTMNTADKSLATVDLALRRRFHFTEMLPQPELLDDVNIGPIPVGDLLRRLNERIEILLDRDHCLGHAAFLPLRDDPTLPALQSIFQRQVLPLLQEYFFEDWQRIAWVLNDHRKAVEHCFVSKPTLDLAILFGEGVEVPERSIRWQINASAFALEESYLGVIG